MICDYASSVQSSDEDSSDSYQKVKPQPSKKPIEKEATASSEDGTTRLGTHRERVNGHESRSSSDSPQLKESSDRDRSHRHRSSHEKHRRSHKESRSKRHGSRSRSRKGSKRRHSSRRHRHSHRDRSSRDDHRGRKSRSRSHRRHRKHRHRSSSSSSDDDHHSRRVYAPTVVRTDSTKPIPTPSKALDVPTPSSEAPKDVSPKEQTTVNASNISSTVTCAPANVAAATVTTSTTTPSTATTASGLRLSTQELLNQIQKHQEAQAKAQAIAAAAAANLPKYYNPSSVNAVKLVEQQQKRKLLWSKKDDAGATSDSKKALWTSTSLIAGKGDTAAAAKFRKLMGIHDTEEQSEQANLPERDTQMQAEAQAELFRRLEQEYEMSRALTHTQRGVGLGFSSATHIDYSAYSAMHDEAKQRDGP